MIDNSERFNALANSLAQLRGAQDSTIGALHHDTQMQFNRDELEQRKKEFKKQLKQRKKEWRNKNAREWLSTGLDFVTDLKGSFGGGGGSMLDDSSGSEE